MDKDGELLKPAQKWLTAEIVSKITRVLMAAKRNCARLNKWTGHVNIKMSQLTNGSAIPGASDSELLQK